ELSGKSVLDLGSGGGFPGVPLALRFPDACVTLADSIGKKAAVLETLVREIPLPNAVVYAGRGEDLLVTKTFDVVIAQAVASTRELLALLAPRQGAFRELALMKGRSWELESSLEEEKSLGFRRASVRPIPSPKGTSERFLLLFQSLDR